MLRNYQAAAVQKARDNIAKGILRNLLVVPTGGGKTAIFCEIMTGASRRGYRSLMAVSGRELVLQAALRVEREGADFGVIMAQDRREDPSKLIQLASIHTLYSRGFCPDFDILVIDEAHLALTPAFKWLIAQRPKAVILSFTATPFHKEGFRSMADAIIQPTSARELIDQGFLVPARYFSPSFPDLSTVKKSGEDYVTKDLANAMNQARLFGDVVRSYKEHGENRPALLFAVNVDHSIRLAKAFNDAGIPANHIDANSSGSTRTLSVANLVAGTTKILCSVGVLGTGFDCPPVSCIISCRPTLSYNLHMQMLGRGSRPSPGKSNFIVLDHAGNVLKHGFYETPRACSLDGKTPVVRLELTVCKSCYCTYRRSEKKCPGILADGSVCEKPVPEPEAKKSEIKSIDRIKLVEINGETIEAEEMKRFIIKTCVDASKRGFKPTFAFLKIKARYGLDAAKASWPVIREIYA